MMGEHVLTSDLAIPPGEYLAEVAEELGLSQSDLATRMNRPPQAINEIIAGTKAITAETALQLERVTGVPAHIWAGLESDYRLTLAKQRDDDAIEEQCELARAFPYKELVKVGAVAPTMKCVERVRELCRFFGVVSLRQISQVADYAPAFRAGRGRTSPEHLAAWLRFVTLQAQRVETREFDRNRLVDLIVELRELTLQPPERFLPPLKTRLAESGVAFVLCQHFPQTYVHGATFWMTSSKAVTALTIRGSWADVFWFSLFHEIGHLVLRHSKKEVFLEDGDAPGRDEEVEAEADRFAANTLIPAEALQEFSRAANFSSASIKRFAEANGIAPGIVVGRLQHEGLVARNFHVYRTRYRWQQQAQA